MDHALRKKIRLEKLLNYNPNAVGEENGCVFGFPFEKQESELILLPIPMDVTTSYRPGTAAAPEQILQASAQLDSYDLDFPNAWQQGIYLDIHTDDYVQLAQSNSLHRAAAEILIEKMTQAEELDEADMDSLEKINAYSEKVNEYVYESCKKIMLENKKIALLGGDHSTPLGMYKALAENESFSILQIDAHCDLRKSYEGFKYSHASIMYNTLEEVQGVKKLVQVGIRDYCEEEYLYIKNHNDRIHTFFDTDLKRAMYQGKSWHQLCDAIIEPLSDNVHISFDIDGLMPYLCDGTGTPVAGGFTLEEVHYLFLRLKQSGRKIISFDLVEVNADENEFNANVGARALLKLCQLILSQEY